MVAVMPDHKHMPIKGDHAGIGIMTSDQRFACPTEIADAGDLSDEALHENAKLYFGTDAVFAEKEPTTLPAKSSCHRQLQSWGTTRRAGRIAGTRTRTALSRTRYPRRGCQRVLLTTQCPRSTDSRQAHASFAGHSA